MSKAERRKACHDQPSGQLHTLVLLVVLAAFVTLLKLNVSCEGLGGSGRRKFSVVVILGR